MFFKVFFIKISRLIQQNRVFAWCSMCFFMVSDPSMLHPPPFRPQPSQPKFIVNYPSHHPFSLNKLLKKTQIWSIESEIIGRMLRFGAITHHCHTNELTALPNLGLDLRYHGLYLRCPAWDGPEERGFWLVF